MRIDEHREGEHLALTLYKEQQPVGLCRLRTAPGRVELEELSIDEDWRGKGYGSYLLKQALHATGGFSTASLHAAPPPETEAAAALLKKFGFAPAGEVWLRRRAPDPSAVSLTHEFLASRLAPGGFFIDATCGNRLERWGSALLVRPDPQVVWKSAEKSPLWQKADAVYHRSEKGGGQWEYRRRLPEKWKIGCGELTLVVSPTGFKHTGVFPEQAVNWAWYGQKIRGAGRPVRVLNLFGYPGGATLACAAAAFSALDPRLLSFFQRTQCIIMQNFFFIFILFQIVRIDNIKHDQNRELR